MIRCVASHRRRGTGQYPFGQGARYGSTVGMSLAGVTMVADFYRTVIVMGQGPASGFSDLSGVMIGLALHD